MMNWFLQLVFDKFDCSFIGTCNYLDLKDKKLIGFLSVESFLHQGVQLQKSQAKSFL